VRLLIIKASSWDVYWEFYIGIALSVLSLILLYLAFVRSPKGVISWLLLPLLSSLLFSASQVNTYTFGFLALSIGIGQLGLAMAVWGLVRFPGRWMGVGWLVVGGCLATLSGGAGLMVWPASLLGLWLLGFRKISQYAVWLFAATLTSLPYAVFGGSVNGAPLQLERDLRLFYDITVRGLGLPFTQNFAYELAARPGLVGILLGIIGLLILWSKRHTAVLPQSTPALMLMAYSLMNVWLIGLGRGHTSAPWYPGFFILYWVGLVGLAYTFWTNYQGELALSGVRDRLRGVTAGVWSMAVVAAIILLYLTSNLTFGDKVFFLWSRTPASAACLRHFLTAPTYCEDLIFQWGVGNPELMADLAEPLQRHGLSVFSDHQTWTLQGDFVLDNVRIHETPGVPEIYWSADRSATPVSRGWRDYRHLNLFLHTPNAVTWTIAIPPSANRADFHSAVTISDSAPNNESSDGVQFEVYLERQDHPQELIYDKWLPADERQWQPFTVPLRAYAGKTITLRLTSKSDDLDQAQAMYRYPYIDVSLEPGSSPIPYEPVESSTPSPTSRDVIFDLQKSRRWHVTDLEPLMVDDGIKTSVVGPHPSLELRPQLDICLADYTHLYIQMAISPEIPTRALHFYYTLDYEGRRRWQEDQSVKIPLYGDGEIHDYYYDLKLLELPIGAKLTRIRLNPVFGPTASGDSLIQIVDLRLFRCDDDKIMGTH
jgi:hypothetical protein